MTIHITDENYFYGALPISVEVPQETRELVKGKFVIPSFGVNVEGFSLDDIPHGKQVSNEILLLSEFSVEKASNNNPFLKITFSNSKSAVKAKMWDNDGSVEKTKAQFEQDSVFVVSGKVEEYPRDSGNKSIIANSIVPYNGPVNAGNLIAATARNVEDYVTELYYYLDTLEEPHRTIALKGFDLYWEEFVVKPAAKGKHHNYLNGLLKHTVGLMRIARYVVTGEDNPYTAAMKLIGVAQKQANRELWASLTAETPTDTRKMVWFGSLDHLSALFYEMSKLHEKPINLSQLIACIFYHDIGKVFEYTHVGETDKFSLLFPNLKTSHIAERPGTGIAMDSLGAKVGHMPYGTMILKDVIERNNIEISIEEIHDYFHNILAHHGKYEWGSPVKPQTIEAWLLHFVDYLDSRWEVADGVK